MGRYPSVGWIRRLRAEDRAIVDASLERVGMQTFARRQIGQLSGGQRQRVFVARALAQRAELLILDEPFAGIDARTEAALLTLLAEAARPRGALGGDGAPRPPTGGDRRHRAPLAVAELCEQGEERRLGAGVDPGEVLSRGSAARRAGRGPAPRRRAGAGRRRAGRSGGGTCMPTRSSDASTMARSSAPQQRSSPPNRVAAHLHHLAHGDGEVPSERLRRWARRPRAAWPRARAGRGSSRGRHRHEPERGAQEGELPEPFGPTIADMARPRPRARKP